MDEVSVPKEYVRRQLLSLGMVEITDEELEAYTRDFSRLVQEHLQHDVSSDASSCDSTVRSGTPQSLDPRVPGTGEETKPAGVLVAMDTYADQTPVVSHSHIVPHTPGSAVFKTFPGDKENRVQYLPPSATPSPVRVKSLSSALATRGVGTSLSHGGKPPGLPERVARGGQPPGLPERVARRRPLKRKVLRRYNGELCVFDESLSDSGSAAGSPGVGEMERQLSELSITSVSSTDTSQQSLPRGQPQAQNEGPSPPGDHPHRPQYKSFIRPPTNSHLRRFKKCDPVSRYHEWRQLWDTQKAPGEKNRHDLRWHIREQLLHQDVPLYEPIRRMHRPNDFVVPTEKKRSALRWGIRHQLANHQ